MAASLSVRVTQFKSRAAFSPPMRLAGSHGLGKRRVEVTCSEMYSSIKSLYKCSGPNIEKHGNVGQLCRSCQGHKINHMSKGLSRFMVNL